jgi:hypothetical protein
MQYTSQAGQTRLDSQFGRYEQKVAFASLWKVTLLTSFLFSSSTVLRYPGLAPIRSAFKPR